MSGTKPDLPDVPDLVIPSPSQKPQAAEPAKTQRAPAPAVSTGDPRELALPPMSDDDDLDMQIERGDGAAIMNVPQTSYAPRTSSTSGIRPSSSLELGAPLRVSARPSRPEASREEPSIGKKLLASAAAIVAFAAPFALLVKLLHRPGGRPVEQLLPAAFDGSSTIHSGAVSLGALGVAIALGYVGVRTRPRTVGFVFAAAAMLVFSLAMVTVTLVSTEEDPAPADGLLLVPYALPAAIFAFGLGLAERCALYLTSSRTFRKAIAIPLALAGGALGWCAYEASFLAITP